MALAQWKYALRDQQPPTNGAIAIAAICNRRWVEWAVFSACYLIKMGYKPTLLYSSRRIAEIYGGDRRPESSRRYWHAVTDIPFIKLCDIDEYATEALACETSYDAFAAAGAHTVAAYNLRIEEREPDQAPGEYAAAIGPAAAMLKRTALCLEGAVKELKAMRVICPSGIIGESLAIREVLRRHSIDAVYVEGWALRPGHLIWNRNAPALEYDVAGWLNVLGEWSDELERDAQDYMSFREGNAVPRCGWLDSFHQVQRAKPGDLPQHIRAFLERPGKCFLLGTNVVGDSSTLQRATIFRSQQDWLFQVVEFFRKHVEYKLVIRAHPDETWVDARIRMGRIARAAQRMHRIS